MLINLDSYNLFWIKLCFKNFIDNLMHALKNFQLMCSMLICFLLIWRVHPVIPFSSSSLLAASRQPRRPPPPPACPRRDPPTPGTWPATRRLSASQGARAANSTSPSSTRRRAAGRGRRGRSTGTTSWTRMWPSDEPGKSAHICMCSDTVRNEQETQRVFQGATSSSYKIAVLYSILVQCTKIFRCLRPFTPSLRVRGYPAGRLVQG